MSRQGDGARDHTFSRLHDVTGKVVVPVSPSQVMTIRGSRYAEDSQVTYSGLRLDEYTANPRQNPFVNDRFNAARTGTSATHALVLSSAAVLSTNVYASWFSRDWWRQSSNSAQRPNDAADPACGGMANLLSDAAATRAVSARTPASVSSRACASRTRCSGCARRPTSACVSTSSSQDRRQENGDTPVEPQWTTRREQRAQRRGLCRLHSAPGAVARPGRITPGVRSSACTSRG